MSAAGSAILVAILVAGNAYAEPARVIFTASEPYVPKIAVRVAGKVRWLPLDLDVARGDEVDVTGFGATIAGPRGVSPWPLARGQQALVLDFIHGEMSRVTWAEAVHMLAPLERTFVDRRMERRDHRLRLDLLRRCILALDESYLLARCAEDEPDVARRYTEWRWCGDGLCVQLNSDGTVTRRELGPVKLDDIEDAERALAARRMFLATAEAVDEVWTDRSLSIAERRDRIRWIRDNIEEGTDRYKQESAVEAIAYINTFLNSREMR
jgi:hypothetical protein